jgi:GNAT superfamily N-acetyltransferase
MARAEDDDLVVEFTVQLMEIHEDMPAERLVHEINGVIKLFDFEGQEQQIGTLSAYLFNISALNEEGVYLLEPYDMREGHLAEAINRIFDFKNYEFHPTVVKKASFIDPDFIFWHLHAFDLYLEPQHRGRRRGVRALKLLREFARRPGLLATAKAYLVH